MTKDTPPNPATEMTPQEWNKKPAERGETPTPRTDAQKNVPCPYNYSFGEWHVIKYRDLARQLERELATAQAQIAALERDVKTFKDFADLWYFVMDEVPLPFEKIVTEYSPAVWMQEAAKLRTARKKP